MPLELINGLPPRVAEFVGGLEKNTRSNRFHERAERFADFANRNYEQQQKLIKAWSAIASNAAPALAPETAEVKVFILLPDSAEYNPHNLVFGGRPLDASIVEIERRRYKGYLEHVHALKSIFRRPSYAELLQDAQPSSESQNAMVEFRRLEEVFFKGLDLLEQALASIDPALKVPTKHFNSPDASKKNFALLIAGLNRSLKRPQHAALACLAGVNCPEVNITPEAIRKAWKSITDKPA